MSERAKPEPEHSTLDRIMAERQAKADKLRGAQLPCDPVAIARAQGFEVSIGHFDHQGMLVGGKRIEVPRSESPVAQRWAAVTGRPLIEGYGLSETSPVVTANPTNATAYSGSIGLPLPSTEVQILDDEGRPLAAGERGEIAVRGLQVMTGYWNAPQDTRAAMTSDGFFRTGDIGYMDTHGYVFLVDRKKDLIVVSGFNVYPSEVEAVVSGHPGVLECAAIGMSDEASGEAVKLFVVRADPQLTEEAVQDWCRRELSRYKCPRTVEFRSELPKSNVGKILRRALRPQ